MMSDEIILKLNGFYLENKRRRGTAQKGEYLGGTGLVVYFSEIILNLLKKKKNLTSRRKTAGVFETTQKEHSLSQPVHFAGSELRGAEEQAAESQEPNEECFDGQNQPFGRLQKTGNEEEFRGTASQKSVLHRFSIKKKSITRLASTKKKN